MSGPERDDVFEAHEIRVWRFVLNELLTNGFVVQERDGDALAVIDPGDRADDLIEAAEAWGGDVRWILVTHLHGDHCARVGDLAAAFPAAEVAGPPGGPFRPHRPVSGGETLDLGPATIQVAVTALRVVSVNPVGAITAAFSSFDVTFNQVINAATFTGADVSITGPGGSLAVMTNSDTATSATLNAAQGAEGVYNFNVGGAMSLPAGTAPGAYSGSFQVSVHYN